MRSYLNRDLMTGALIFGLGLAATLYAQSSYQLGTFRTPGPGLFPTLVSSLLTLVGVGLLLQALLAPVPETLPQFETRPFVLVMVAVAAFAVIFPYLGYALAVFALSLISSFADDQMKLTRKMVLAAVVTGIAVLLFRGILGVRLPVFGMGGF
ncbi:hypothetical protein GCM10011534_38000 [Pseudooceanicola nanhaiensis]|jgi:hypothetical protein|uniref:DUF1468 domain-containing protein n=1 Tax=Pseudooceanicola nanhaiensis TaxID=375761 RepID=A0A917WLI9_9RHOB|nr:tripartite tricarboxylate transporter TctB family protein [Pseudooceanicola nanhaiensis]GGM12231.1 hypothetical protein GCM10011534_38000 [Pseudooceanicola nanhaiensis]